MRDPSFVHTFPNPDVLIFYRRGERSPSKRKLPDSHLFTLWERLPLDLLRGRHHHPVRSWDPNDDSLSSLALQQVILSSRCLSRATFHTPPPLSQRALACFFFFSKWVTNGSTDIDVLCGWMVPPVLNCCYCNYEAHPASFRDYEKRQLAHIVLILTEICSIWIVCNMNFDVLHECQ